MTVKEVARYPKISRASVYRFMREGLLVPCRLGPRVVRFRQKDLDSVLLPRPTEQKSK